MVPLGVVNCPFCILISNTNFFLRTLFWIVYRHQSCWRRRSSRSEYVSKEHIVEATRHWYYILIVQIVTRDFFASKIEWKCIFPVSLLFSPFINFYYCRQTQNDVDYNVLVFNFLAAAFYRITYVNRLEGPSIDELHTVNFNWGKHERNRGWWDHCLLADFRT